MRMATTPPSPPVPVIVNTRSGSARPAQTLDAIRARFREAGLVAQIHCTGEGTDLAEMARQAMASKPPLVVAAGGDGTLSAVAQVARAHDATLGVIPMGTLNHFARDLGIPLDLEGAVRVIASGRRCAIDMGEVNGEGFLNNSSLGIYPVIVRGRTLHQRRLGGRKYPAMVWATLSVMRRSPFLRVKLQLDDRVHDCRSPFVFVGNNEYQMEGFDIGTRERLDRGRLSVYTTRRHTRWGLFALAVRALFGRLEQADDFDARSASTLRVESHRRRLLVARDGEVSLMDTPLEYRIVPGALRVMLPPREA